MVSMGMIVLIIVMIPAPAILMFSTFKAGIVYIHGRSRKALYASLIFLSAICYFILYIFSFLYSLKKGSPPPASIAVLCYAQLYVIMILLLESQTYFLKYRKPLYRSVFSFLILVIGITEMAFGVAFKFTGGLLVFRSNWELPLAALCVFAIPCLLTVLRAWQYGQIGGSALQKRRFQVSVLAYLMFAFAVLISTITIYNPNLPLVILFNCIFLLFLVLFFIVLETDLNAKLALRPWRFHESSISNQSMAILVLTYLIVLAPIVSIYSVNSIKREERSSFETIEEVLSTYSGLTESFLKNGERLLNSFVPELLGGQAESSQTEQRILELSNMLDIEIIETEVRMKQSLYGSDETIGIGEKSEFENSAELALFDEEYLCIKYLIENKEASALIYVYPESFFDFPASQNSDRLESVFVNGISDKPVFLIQSDSVRFLQVVSEMSFADIEEGYFDYEEGKSIFVTAPFAGGLFLTATMRSEEAIAKAVSDYIFIIVGLLIGTLIAAFFALNRAEALISEIKGLEMSIRSAIAGKGDYIFDTKSINELGELADSYNELSSTFAKTEIEYRGSTEIAYRNLEERIAELQELYEFSKNITSLKGVYEIGEAACKRIEEMIPIKACVVFLYGKKGNELVSSAGLDERICQNSIEKLKKIKHKEEMGAIFGDKTDYIEIPMEIVGKNIGTLMIIDSISEIENVSEDRRHFLNTISKLLAPTINNAVLFDRISDTLSELEELDRMKADFIAGMSHELRTPLTIIKSFSSTISENLEIFIKDEARFNKMIDVIKEQANILIERIGEILEIAKVGTEELNLDFKSVDLRQLTEKMIILMRATTPFHSISATFELRDSGWVIECDESRISQVLKHLIENSIKFSPQEASIHILCIAESDHIEISVSDEGAGFDTDKMEKIFDIFYQEDMSTTRIAGGMGIGLYVCKRLVESHSGTIFAKNKEGGGAVITVRLPRHQ